MQVLLKWAVQRGTGAIPKASSEPHLADNIEGLFAWRLAPAHKAALDALDEGRRLVAPIGGHSFEAPEAGGAAKPSAVL